jgi:Ca2+-binding RTX toxin-like protein
LAGGISNIRNVRGGQGGNILIGNSQGNILIGGASSNTIKGGTGRSILIGGKGKDTVTGGSGNDILIAGYTNYDTSSKANDIALEAILAEWQSADAYGTRVTKIKAGLPGGYKLVWGSTVNDNSKSNANKLTGAGEPGAHTWFFANVLHTKTNKSPSEQLN